MRRKGGKTGEAHGVPPLMDTLRTPKGETALTLKNEEEATKEERETGGGAGARPRGKITNFAHVLGGVGKALKQRRGKKEGDIHEKKEKNQPTVP